MMKKAEEQEKKRKQKEKEKEFKRAQLAHKRMQKDALKGRVTALGKMDRTIAIKQAQGEQVQWYHDWRKTVEDKRYLTKNDFTGVKTHYANYCQTAGVPYSESNITYVTNVYVSSFNREATYYRRMRHDYPRYHYWMYHHHYGGYHHGYYSWTSYSDFSDRHHDYGKEPDAAQEAKLEEDMAEERMIEGEEAVVEGEEAAVEGEGAALEEAGAAEIVEGEMMEEAAEMEIGDEMEDGFFDLEEGQEDPFEGEEFEDVGGDIDDIEMYAGAEPIDLKDPKDPGGSGPTVMKSQEREEEEARVDAIEAAIKADVEGWAAEWKARMESSVVNVSTQAWSVEEVDRWFTRQWNECGLKAQEKALEISTDLPFVTRMKVYGNEYQPSSTDVTAVTQLSVDRLKALRAFAQRWKGPISACVFIREQVDEEVMGAFLRSMSAKSASRFVISFVYALPTEGDYTEYERMYPINKLRNVALSAAPTDMVFLVDADFVPSPNLYPSISDEDNFAQICDLMEAKRSVLVVPAFEIEKRAAYPSTMEELRDALNGGTAHVFHEQHFAAGHSATDTPRWLYSQAPYEVKYEVNYEPYIIAKKSTLPHYDERFRGYGMNKISHLYNVAADGHHFFVLPGVFITAREHPRSSSWKAMYGKQSSILHRVRIAELFTQFKHECEVRNRMRMQELVDAKVVVPTLDVTISPTQLWAGHASRAPFSSLLNMGKECAPLCGWMSEKWWTSGKEWRVDIAISSSVSPAARPSTYRGLLAERALVRARLVASQMKAGRDLLPPPSIKAEVEKETRVEVRC
uniref:Uncharacterized protein n=1 Tax=Palpitomonas bilix TaxID=652834 RepID=A0A7S3CWR7_9EUKA